MNIIILILIGMLGFVCYVNGYVGGTYKVLNERDTRVAEIKKTLLADEPNREDYYAGLEEYKHISRLERNDG